MQTIESKGKHWLHISQLNEKDLSHIEQEFKFHPLDYEDIRDDTPLPKLDVYKHYLFGIFHVPILDLESGNVQAQELYVFLSEQTIVTITRVPSDVIEKFVRKLTRAPKLRAALLGKGTAFFLYKILLEVFRDALPLLKSLATNVASMETEIEQGHGRKTTVKLGRIRRNVLYLRHIVAPQQKMLETIGHLNTSFLPESNEVYFDDIHDALTTMSLTSENLKLIIDGLFDVNEALLSHKTNDVVTLLTIISASIMAPALVAGFYGMNVPWLPWAGNPLFISVVYGISVIGIILLMLLVTRKHQS